MRHLLSVTFGWIVLTLALPPWVSGQGSYVSLQYLPSNDNFPNPERGFHRSPHPPLWLGTERAPLDESTLRRYRNEGLSLIRAYYVIDEFRDAPLSHATLDAITADFATVRASGLKIIPRFAYSFPCAGSLEPCGPENFGETDAALARVLGHIAQLGPVLHANADVIAFMEMGFVGAWGEWHSSTNGLVGQGNTTTASSAAVIQAVVAALPTRRMTALRYPYQKQSLFGSPPLTAATAFNGTPQARIGAHNDCFLSNVHDGGTYSTPYPPFGVQPELFKQYLNQDNRYVPQTGETCSFAADAQPYIQCPNALADLARMRWSALNIEYQPQVLDLWRQQGCFPEIERRLGYRLRLVGADMPLQVAAGGLLQLRLAIANDGFAAPYNPRVVELVLRHATTRREYPFAVNADPRLWGGGETQTVDVTVRVPPGIELGSYELLLNLPDPEPALRGRPEYSIRLANIGVWEASTGYNSLQATFEITASPPDRDGDGLPDEWETRFALNPDSATSGHGGTGDPDGDGVDNLAEYQRSTDPTLPNVWNLPEGATGFFTERIAVANPGTESATFTVTYLPESGSSQSVVYTLGARSRRTITVNEIAGLSNAAVSAVVTTTRGGVVVERTMLWNAQDGSFYGGHTGKAIPQARTTWYLAEGEASFFDTYILLANANASTATVTLSFLLENGNTITDTRTVPANSRVTVYANDVPGLRGNAFSTTITSSIPVTVERAMYFGNRVRLFNGGHGAAAVEAPATSWFVAEGRTGSFFDMYVLLANPGTVAANVTITFLLPNGTTVVQNRTLSPTSRTTIHVDSVPGLADTDVSASITSDQPIIVERAMYWPDPFTNWYEAHNSAGVTATGTKWALAEGEIGGSFGFETYVLLANPGSSAATVTLAFLRESGSPLTLTRNVPANGRLTVSAGESALASGEKFGVLIDSTQPIAVERAMYWNGGGQFWGAGTNETGVRIR
jgi:hypothetical protein